MLPKKPMSGTSLSSHSSRADFFSESVIREMTRHALAHNAINLAQGFPDFPCPPELKAAACAALNDDFNQYAITWGAQDFREAIARKAKAYNGMAFNPETEITVTCGSTEAMMASMLALISPGDEVIVPEPFYENYGPDAVISGAVPRYVPLGDGATIDEEAWKAAFTDRTRAIIINTPNNPTGKVFSRDELRFIADLCREHDVIAITDEIYEHILYDGNRHVSMGSLPGMEDRTVTIGSLSKTYSVTGWRVGYALADAGLRDASGRSTIFSRSVHQPRSSMRRSLPSACRRRIIVSWPGTMTAGGKSCMRALQRRALTAGSLRVHIISSPISPGSA